MTVERAESGFWLLYEGRFMGDWFVVPCEYRRTGDGRGTVVFGGEVVCGGTKAEAVLRFRIASPGEELYEPAGECIYRSGDSNVSVRPVDE